MKLLRELGCKNWLDFIANLAEIVVMCAAFYLFIVVLCVAAGPAK